MAATQNPHKLDIGIVFLITVTANGQALDISGATVKQMKFLKPDGSNAVVTAQFSSDGKDGVLKYVTIANDLNQVGSWGIQGYISIPSFTGHTDMGSFQVDQSIGV